MLAKVPLKRGDGKSSFKDLIEYVTTREKDNSTFRNLVEYVVNRDEYFDKDKLTNEFINTSNRPEYQDILKRTRINLETARNYLSSTRRTDSINAGSLREHFRSVREATYSNESIDGNSKKTSRGENIDVNQYQRSITNCKSYLRSADSYIRQNPNIDRDFQDRIRARRAYISRNVRTNKQEDQHDPVNIELRRLLGESERLILDNVVCEHNCLSFNTVSVEMAAVAAQNSRVKDSVYHFILSWPDSETPTDDQAFHSVRHAINAVGMEGHQYMAAIHNDTNNTHVHVVVNRVNPDNFSVVYPDRDFYKLDKAMRELELYFGFKHDKGPYAVFEQNGQTIIDWASKSNNTKGKKPTAAADMERQADTESLFSYARGEPRREIIKLLKKDDIDWDLLHETLAKFGLALKEKGAGFAVHDMSNKWTTPIKASDLHENLSKARLVKKLGKFQPAADNITETKKISSYNKYVSPKRNPQEREDRKQERARLRAELRKRYNLYTKSFVHRRLNPDEVKKRYWQIRQSTKQQRQNVKLNVKSIASRKALYSVIAFESLREKSRLKDIIDAERATLRMDPSNKKQTYKEWVHSQAIMGDPAAISQLRGWAYSDKRAEKELKTVIDNGSVDGIRSNEPFNPIAIDLANTKYSIKYDGTVVYTLNGSKNQFTDHGQKITVTCKTVEVDYELIMSALLLAKEKYGPAFEVTGSDEFKRHVQKLLNDNRLDIELKNIQVIKPKKIRQ